MRSGLSPTALAELEIGSQQDHNARHERHTRMLSAAYEAKPVSWLTVCALITAISFGMAFVGYHLGPVFFNPFAR